MLSMKETDRRRGLTPNNKGKRNPARPDTRYRKQQDKNGGRRLKAKEIDDKPSSDVPNANTDEPSENFENVDIDYVDDAFRSQDELTDTNTPKMDEKHVTNNSSDVEIENGATAETIDDFVSSQGELQAADEEKAENVDRISKKTANDYSHDARSKSDRSTNNPKMKVSKQTRKEGIKEKGISKSTACGSSNNSKNMKVHPKPKSDILDEHSNGTDSMSSIDEIVSTEEYDNRVDQAGLDGKIEEMENRIKTLESELRQVAALEVALYSVVPEHIGSSHKLHSPARRLFRLYINARKLWTQDRPATVARNTVSGLVLVSKSCSNDVSRLMFWLSNTVILREMISQTFGDSCHSSAVAKKPFASYGGETMSSPHKWKNTNGSTHLNQQSLLQFVDDWQETLTFTAALEKIEYWIFLRIVESIWWQTLTPNMQSPVGDSTTNKGAKRILGPALSDQNQGKFSINLWKNAFHDAFKGLCPVRARGHDCGCLPVLARKVMEQCIGRLDVAMFNAILRESIHEIPTDPVSDPIVDSKVLPIPAGDLSFGSGAQLKNSVGTWARWLSEYLGMDADVSAKGDNNVQDHNEERSTREQPKTFPLLNALSELLMLPKDMVIDHAIRMEVCPSISLPLIKRVLCNFSPDEFCPDPVPGAVLEAINAETRCIGEHGFSGSSFPYGAAPTMYSPPSSSEVAGKASEACVIPQSAEYTSDEELNEVESCLVDTLLPLSPMGNNGNDKRGGGSTRYNLLREFRRI